MLSKLSLFHQFFGCKYKPISLCKQIFIRNSREQNQEMDLFRIWDYFCGRWYLTTTSPRTAPTVFSSFGCLCFCVTWDRIYAFMWYSNQPQPSSQPTSDVPYNPWRLTSYLVQTPREETFWLTLSQGPSLVTKFKHAHCSKLDGQAAQEGLSLADNPRSFPTSNVQICYWLMSLMQSKYGH